MGALWGIFSPWLELEGLAEVHDGVATLTPAGIAWVGAYPAPPDVALPMPVPRRTWVRGRKPAELRGTGPYGDLTPKERVGRNAAGNASWLCECACGNLCVVSARHLLSHHTRSCGCLRRRRAPAPPASGVVLTSAGASEVGAAAAASGSESRAA